jgi:probable F420-dependent oxidoreductase
VGYDHLVVYDHVLGATHDREPALWGPYTDKTPFHEPFVLFAYLAAATTSIEFATGVLILPQRQTALVAKQAAEVDVLSGGRLRLGVGVGWNYVEYDALGEDFGNRGKRQEEQVELLRRLWREPVLDYEGDYHRIDRAGILPLPEREIPIWFGGFVSAAYERGARLGDGFMYGGAAAPSVEALVETREHLERAGRNAASFGSELIMRTEKVDAGHWASEVQAWNAAGGTHASVVTMDLGLDPEDHIAAIEVFKRAADDAL